MSHFTTVEAKFTNLVCLKKSITDLGFTFVEAQQGVLVRGWHKATEKADISIKVSKRFDVGIRRTATGYEFVADWWGVETTLGWTQEEFIQKLTQRYAYHTVMQEAKNKGYTLVEEEVEENQTIKITLQRWN